MVSLTSAELPKMKSTSLEVATCSTMEQVNNHVPRETSPVLATLIASLQLDAMLHVDNSMQQHWAAALCVNDSSCQEKRKKISVLMMQLEGKVICKCYNT